VELLQAGLLYTVIAWILTIPLRIFFFSGVVANTGLFLAVVVLGLIYLILFSRKDEASLNAVASLNTKGLHRNRKAAWLIWALFIAVTAAFTTAKYFGSNIWFAQPLHIDGPYQFSLIVADYALPFISIILPLLFGKACILAVKYEVENN